MKKVKLTQEEELEIKEIIEIQKQMGLLSLKSKKMLSDFWFKFQTRMGGGSYSLNVETREMWKKSFEERMAADEENK